MTDTHVNVRLTHSYARHDSLSISKPRQIEGHETWWVSHHVWRDLFMYVTWRLIHTHDKTHAYARQDSFGENLYLQATAQAKWANQVTWFIHYVQHDSFMATFLIHMHVTWLMNVRDTTHSSGIPSSKPQHKWNESFIMCTMTHWYARHESFSRHPHIHILFNLYTCDMTRAHTCDLHSYTLRPAFIYIVTRPTHVRDMTHSVGIPTSKPRHKPLAVCKSRAFTACPSMSTRMSSVKICVLIWVRVRERVLAL